VLSIVKPDDVITLQRGTNRYDVVYKEGMACESPFNDCLVIRIKDKVWSALGGMKSTKYVELPEGGIRPTPMAVTIFGARAQNPTLVLSATGVALRTDMLVEHRASSDNGFSGSPLFVGLVGANRICGMHQRASSEKGGPNAAIDLGGLFRWIDYKSGRPEDSASWVKRFIEEHEEEYREAYDRHGYYDDDEGVTMVKLHGKWFVVPDPENDEAEESDYDSEEEMKEFEDKIEKESRENPHTGHQRESAIVSVVSSSTQPRKKETTPPTPTPSSSDSEDESAFTVSTAERKRLSKKKKKEVKEAKAAEESAVKAKAVAKAAARAQRKKNKAAKAASTRAESALSTQTQKNSVPLLSDTEKLKKELAMVKELLESALKQQTVKTTSECSPSESYASVANSSELAKQSAKNSTTLQKTQQGRSKSVTGSKRD
jgi:hypothetical protein